MRWILREVGALFMVGPVVVAMVLLSAHGSDPTNGANAASDPDAAAIEALREVLVSFVDDEAAVERLLATLDGTAVEMRPRLSAVGPVSGDQLRWLLRDRVLDNLEGKRALGRADGVAFPLTEDEIARTVIGYEAFKVEAYVTSGVFPKRYFGYVDGKWDTAEQEVTLALTTHACVGVINQWLAEHDEPLRVNDREVAVTWISEGGALLLGELSDQIDDVHPVYGVGLDDIKSGTRELAELMARLDQALDTDLAGIVSQDDRYQAERYPRLNRHMTFEESVAGTALMWVWEKRIAQGQLREAGRRLLHQRPLDEQFILGSLVYNSGLIHDAGRELMIRDLSCGPWLEASSERNAARRPELNLVGPAETLAELVAGLGYREQWTSWLAVYHVTQRYGGWLALTRFTDVFDVDGAFDMPRWERLDEQLQRQAAAEAAHAAAAVGVQAESEAAEATEATEATEAAEATEATVATVAALAVAEATEANRRLGAIPWVLGITAAVVLPLVVATAVVKGRRRWESL